MSSIKKRCEFYSVDSKECERFISIYKEDKNGKITWDGKTVSKCNKIIYTERGGDPLCKDHFSEEFASYLKNQRRLKRKYDKQLLEDNKKRFQNDGFYVSEANFNLIMWLLLLAPPTIFFILLTFLPMTYGETLVGTTWDYKTGDTSNYLIETGRSKSWQYPNFLRLIISIMLSVPIYTIFLNLADEKKWPTIIFKAIINFIIGVPMLLIIYFFIAFWLLVFGV